MQSGYERGQSAGVDAVRYDDAYHRVRATECVHQRDKRVEMYFAYLLNAAPDLYIIVTMEMAMTTSTAALVPKAIYHDHYIR